MGAVACDGGRAVARSSSGLGTKRRLVRLGIVTQPVRRGEIWFASTPGGDRPVLVLTRDPVASRIQAVVVAALTRTKRHLTSEVDLSPDADGVPTDCIVNFDNLHTLPRASFRRRVTLLSPGRMAQCCATLIDANGC